MRKHRLEGDLILNMKVLVDTSVWINHTRGDDILLNLLSRGKVVMHPYVIGEFSLGIVSSRESMLTEMRKLPQVSMATTKEALSLIEERRLDGSGVGLVDVFLLSSCLIDGNTQLLTADKKLARVATELGINFSAG